MISLNCKHVQHDKIYQPCNFDENLITHLGVIALAVIEYFIKKLVHSIAPTIYLGLLKSLSASLLPNEDLHVVMVV